MAFTYTAGSTADRDRVRLARGDTTLARKLFEDEEIDDVLVQEANSVDGTIAGCLEILATRFARDYDFSADGSSFKKSSVSAMYMKRARFFRSRARGTSVLPAQRKDGYSDDIKSDEVDTSSRLSAVDFFDRI